MGVKRRAFLIGGAVLIGGGAFGVSWADRAARNRAAASTAKAGEASFLTWFKIAEDDTVTLYSPHIDFGQGSNTALAQMLAEELDADWSKVRVEQAPAETAFANTPLLTGFASLETGRPGLIGALPQSLLSMAVRTAPIQITGGSSAVRATGQFGMRVIGASARLALIDEAAERLKVPASELTTADSRVTHAKSGKSLRYGELAVAAAARSLESSPKLKDAKDFKLIGKPVRRLDVADKVTGKAQYGIDFSLPEMRVATIMAAPRGGKLMRFTEKVPGVEKVIALDDAVVVVAKGYWQATKGLQAAAPQFSPGDHASVTTPAFFAAQDALRKKDDPEKTHGETFVASGGAKTVEADYRVPFLHHAMMEPPALTGHFKDGKLDIWGGVQDPLAAKMLAAEAAGLDKDDVTFHPMIMGGGFGRRFPDKYEIIGQLARLAVQLPYPVKLIWSREEDVTHGTYRAQSSAHLKAALDADGGIAAWRSDYVQNEDAEGETRFPYTLPIAERRFFEIHSNQNDGPWRSVNSTQQGFYNESFIDELAHAAGQDPYQYRRKYLKPGSRHLAVLDEVAKRSGWGSPLPAGRGRGIAIVESFGTIAAEVIEASMGADGRPKVHKIWAAIDCGTTVSPLNAEAQVMGGIVMGLSAAIGEAITLDKGAVVQSNFGDYPILKLAEAPEIDVHFIESGAPIGGLGEPGLPPVAPALANALFAATGKRARQLPLVGNWA